ncbi:MAG: hypothetical protein KBT29_05955 [Prevotellaceae bacterium]|nr:hypothetical protein [Candidatus Minthosoma caballi]
MRIVGVHGVPDGIADAIPDGSVSSMVVKRPLCYPKKFSENSVSLWEVKNL